MTPDTFERLVRQHKDSVYRQMIRVCAQREDAEDALATALMHAFRASEQLASDEAFRSWLGTIGNRVCSRMRTNPHMVQALELMSDHHLMTTNGDEFSLQVLKGCVREAVDNLSELYREVYTSCEIEGLSVPEAADKLGISEAATKSRLLRARANVRQSLDSSICGV